MQVLLNTDPHVDGRHEMAEHLKAVVEDAVGRFADHVTRVEAHLADVTNGHAGAVPNEIHCTLEARLAGRDPLVVKEQSTSAHQALHGAAGKLKRAVATALDKQHSHRGAPPPPLETDAPES